MAHGTISWILVAIWIAIWIQEFFKRLFTIAIPIESRIKHDNCRRGLNSLRALWFCLCSL